MPESKCPICLIVTNRLVKEDCGHSKCRDCFIQEVNGCQECSRSKVNECPEICAENKSEDNCWSEEGSRIVHSKKLQNVAILEDVTIRPETRRDGSATQTRKTIPSHIIQLRTSEGISYKCTVCDRSFKSRSQQYYHLYCNEVLKKPYLCKICSKHFSSLNHFKYHEETHKANLTYQCGRCSKVFTREVTLRKHLRNHDRNSRYSCEECKATFKDKVAYRAHCDKHKDIYPFSCEQCDKRFCLKSTYKQHQLVHCDNTSFECTHCKKRFKRKSSYKAHMVQHSESQPKQICCEICEKMFTSIKAFHRHKRIHDGSSFFKCTFCAVKCKRRDNLARHVKNMHPKEKTDSIEEINFRPDNNSSIEKDVQQVEKNPVFSMNPSLHVQENHTFLNDACASKDTPQTDDSARHQRPGVSQECSVIKSIGNVKPVVVLQNSKTNTAEAKDTQTETKNSATVPLNKKPKKKYDPREIYRKILFASNEEDSLIDETDASTASEDVHLEDETKNKELCKSTTQLNFAEVHWRKRTSQYFSSINVT